MLVKVQVPVVGKEIKTSTKTGKVYGLVSFMDGVDAINAMLDDTAVLEKIELLKVADLTLELKFGKYPKINLIAYSPIVSK